MWTDEMFDEIQKGDKVWYCGAPTMTRCTDQPKQ